jgi:hypothetical protein
VRAAVHHVAHQQHTRRARQHAGLGCARRRSDTRTHT